MFYAKLNTKARGMDHFVARTRDASAAAAHNAAAAAQNAAAASQAAAEAVSNAARTTAVEVNKGVYSARTWAAPRLESAADYTTATMAPKISSALRATARQIAPEDMRRKKTSQALTWSVLAAAVLAAAGAAATLIRQRYRTAMTTGTPGEATSTGEVSGSGTSTATNTAETAPPPASSATATNESAVPGSDTGANGRVSTSGR